MLQYYDEFGERARSSDEVILTASDLGVQTEMMEGVKETIRRLEL